MKPGGRRPRSLPVWALVRLARQEAGLSQRELAGRAGTSQAAIARYERAQVMPDVPTLFRVLRACGFDLRLSLAPHDDHDEELVAANLERSPAEMVATNRSATRLAAAAARSATAARRGG